MLSKKNIIYIVIGAVVLMTVVCVVLLVYKSPSQGQPSGEGAEENTQPEGGLTICADLCGDGVCLSNTCSNDMNCPCPETPENCPQDCGN